MGLTATQITATEKDRHLRNHHQEHIEFFAFIANKRI